MAEINQIVSTLMEAVFEHLKSLTSGEVSIVRNLFCLTSSGHNSGEEGVFDRRVMLNFIHLMYGQQKETEGNS